MYCRFQIQRHRSERVKVIVERSTVRGTNCVYGSNYTPGRVADLQDQERDYDDDEQSVDCVLNVLRLGRA